MSAVNTIELVLGTDLLHRDLIDVPSRGALAEEIVEEESLLPRALTKQHKDLLHRWNGIGLDVIRLFGCGQHSDSRGRLHAMQVPALNSSDGALVIGTDPSGFIYLENRSGVIASYDSDGGDLKRLASSVDELFELIVFGAGANEFAGEEWLDDLRRFQIVR